MKTCSKLTLTFLLLILFVPPVVVANPPKNGPYVEYYENGKKKLEVHCKDGHPDGLATQWHENGQKSIESHWKNGKEEGLSTRWHINGNKESETRWRNSERLTERIKLPKRVTLSFLKKHLMNKTMLQVKAALGPPAVALNQGWFYAIAFVDTKSEQRYKNIVLVFNHDLQDKNKTGEARVIDISGLQFLPGS